MTISDWLWFGAIAMAVGSVILLVMGWNRRTRDEENHYLLHLFVTLTATASYLAMALGQGRSTSPMAATSMWRAISTGRSPRRCC